MDKFEAELPDRCKVAPLVTPADIEASIASEQYFTAADGVAGATDRSAAVSRFLSWPVPRDVHPDGTPGESGRTGTNLLSAPQAAAMLDHVLGGSNVQPTLGLVTFCVLILQNGHRIVGVNTGPVSAANFDANLGRTMARKNAVDQIWPLLGYALRDRLAAAQ